MPERRDVSRLLAEAANAENGQEARRLVGEAETLRTELMREAAREREVDLSNAIIAEHLTPVRVHEHHTAATDWLSEIDTAPDSGEMHNQVLAQASLWYGKTASAIKEHQDEFDQQAYGQARRLAGSFGSLAGQAEELFLTSVASLHEREVRTGAIKLAANPAEGTPGPNGTFPTGNYETALDGAATSSERAPAIQALENNGSGSGGSDVVPVNDPGLGQSNPAAGVQSQENMSKGASSMQSAPCPTCGGHGRVAVRRSATQQKNAYSGLPQVDQVIDPSDTQVQQTPYPAEVAFPWLMQPGVVENAIAENEQQLAEREQRKGASRQKALAAAQAAGDAAYRRALAGYDDSGWAGDMGAQGVTPGEQDGGNAPSSQLGQPDPVWGFGGDQGDRQLKPFAADEANDETNQPSQWAPGQPTQMDMGGQVNSTQAPPAPGFPNPPMGGKQSKVDPEIAKAQAFIAQRQAFLARKSR